MVIFKEKFTQRKHILTHVSIVACLFLVSPVVVFAQIPTPQTFRDVVGILLALLEVAVPLIGTLVLVAVLWSGAQTILNADSPQKLAEGKVSLVWGVIVLAIMVSVWAIIGIIRNTFGV